MFGAGVGKSKEIPCLDYWCLCEVRVGRVLLDRFEVCYLEVLFRSRRWTRRPFTGWVVEV
jgi:hypothetical protein